MSDNVIIEVGEDGNGSNKLIDALNRLAQSSDKVETSTNKLAASVDKFGSRAKNAADDTTLLSRSLKSVGTGFSTLDTIASGALAALSVSKLISFADGYTNINNSLKLVTSTQAETNRAMDASFAIAQDTRQAWDATAGIYGKVATTLKDLNMEQSKTAPLTSTINKAVALVSTSADSARAGLYQFQQALASGVLRGEEFNSVMENTPGLARALAAGMKNGVGVSLGELRRLANDGQLTTKILIDALEQVAPQVAKAFAQSAPTLSQAFTVANNSVMRYIGTADQANGVTAALAKSIIFLSQNIDTVGPIVLTLAGAMGVLAGVRVALWAVTSAKALMSIVSAGTAVAGVMGGSLLASLRGVTVAGGLLASVLGVTAGGAIATVAAVAAAAAVVFKLLGGNFTELGQSVLKFIAYLDGGDASFGRIRSALDGTNTSLKTSKDYYDNLSTTVKNTDGTLNVFAGTLKATGSQAQTSGANVGTSSATVIKAGQAYQTAGLQIVGMGANASNTGVQVLTASRGFEVLREGVASVAPAATTANTALTAHTTTLNQTKTAVDGVKTAHTGLQAANTQTQTAIATTNQSLLSSVYQWLTTGDLIGKAATALLNYVRGLMGLPALQEATNTSLSTGKTYVDQLNASLGTAKYAWDEKTKSITLTNAALGANIPAATGSAAANDNAAKSVSAHGNAASKTSGQVKTLADTLKELQATSANAAQQSAQLTQQFTQLATSAAGSEARVDALSRALRDSYSPAAVRAAQEAATLADNLYGSGSAAAMAATQYEQAASSADRYASSASNAASAASSFQYAHQSSSYGGSGGGEFSNNIGTFQDTFKGQNLGLAREVHLGNPDEFWNANDKKNTLYAAQQAQNSRDAFSAKYGWAEYSDYLAYQKDPAGFDREVSRLQRLAIEGKLKTKGENPVSLSFEQYWKYYRGGGGAPAFAHGGDFMVGGNGGTDSRLVQFYASPDESVHIRTPAQRYAEERDEPAQRGPGVTVIKSINVVTKDADSFRVTRRQQARDAAKQLGKAMRR